MLVAYCYQPVRILSYTNSNKIWYYATFNWYATFFHVYYLISTSHPKIDFVMCNLLQNSRWIKYWLLALSQSDCRILTICIIMIIMTIAMWFAQKDTSNKFPDFNLFTYLQLGCLAQFSLNNVHKRGLKHHHFISLQLGCWSIHCIWYSVFK